MTTMTPAEEVARIAREVRKFVPLIEYAELVPGAKDNAEEVAAAILALPSVSGSRGVERIEELESLIHRHVDPFDVSSEDEKICVEIADRVNALKSTPAPSPAPQEQIEPRDIRAHCLALIILKATGCTEEQAFKAGDDCYRYWGLLSRAPAPEWQPIETAPKDGRGGEIIAFVPWSNQTDENDRGYVAAVYWDPGYEGGPDEPGYAATWITCTSCNHVNPTHWMPLPTPPHPAKQK